MLTLLERVTLGLMVIMALIAVACGGGETDVTITRPEQGSTLDAGSVTVSVDVKKFGIVDKLGEAPEEGEGHVHFYMDAGEIPTVDGEPAVTADETTYHAQATREFTWEDVEPGEHTFAVQLVNNDHTPLRPPVIAQVTVDVEADGDGGATPTRSPAPTEEPTEEAETETPEVSPEESPEETPEETATPTPMPTPTSTP